MADQIELSKKAAMDGMEIFLRNFAHIPDDKLTWTPTPTAKSALRIAAHTALYAGRFAAMIRARALPKVDNVEEWTARNVAEEIAITSREEMERVFKEGTAEVLAALNTLTPEEAAGTIHSDMGWTASMAWLMNLPGWHATVHLGQIDYLQTCWDDHEIYLA